MNFFWFFYEKIIDFFFIWFIIKIGKHSGRALRLCLL